MRWFKVIPLKRSNSGLVCGPPHFSILSHSRFHPVKKCPPRLHNHKYASSLNRRNAATSLPDFPVVSFVSCVDWLCLHVRLFIDLWSMCYMWPNYTSFKSRCNTRKWCVGAGWWNESRPNMGRKDLGNISGHGRNWNRMQTD